MDGIAMNKSRAEQIEYLTRKAVWEKLAGLGDLPEEVRRRVQRIYAAFVPVYLEMMRMKHGYAMDWLPDSIAIDSELVEGLRHFFSDYQRITNDFISINRKMEKLRKIDKETYPDLFVDQVRAFLSDQDDEEMMRKISEQ